MAGHTITPMEGNQSIMCAPHWWLTLRMVNPLVHTVSTKSISTEGSSGAVSGPAKNGISPPSNVVSSGAGSSSRARLKWALPQLHRWSMKTRSLADARSPSANATFSCCWARSVKVNMRCSFQTSLGGGRRLPEKSDGFVFVRHCELNLPLLEATGEDEDSFAVGVVIAEDRQGVRFQCRPVLLQRGLAFKIDLVQVAGVSVQL